MSEAPPPVVLVTGSDAGLVGSAIRAHVNRWDPSGLGVEDLIGEEPDLNAVLDACVTPAFLTEHRVVVFRDAGRFKADQLAPLITYLADPLPTTILLIEWIKDTAAPKALVEACKKVGTVESTSVGGRPQDRRTWVVDQLSSSGLKADAAAGALLVDHLGEDVARLPVIIQTLLASYGKGARIGPEELEPFLGGAGGVAPWDLTDAIDNGDMDKALDYLHRMLGGGDRHPLVVMSTLQTHYGRMLRLDGAGVSTEGEAAALLGLKVDARGGSFPAKKAMNLAKRLGSDAIAQAIGHLATADVQLRGVVDWPEHVVMEVLVARLCRLSKASAPAGAGRGRR